MSIPTVHTTPAELHTALFWAEHIDPVAQANGIDLADAYLEADLEADRHCHLLKTGDGRACLVVRTDRQPVCCPFHDRFTTSLVSCEEARIDRGVPGHRLVYGP